MILNNYKKILKCGVLGNSKTNITSTSFFGVDYLKTGSGQEATKLYDPTDCYINYGIPRFATGWTKENTDLTENNIGAAGNYTSMFFGSGDDSTITEDDYILGGYISKTKTKLLGGGITYGLTEDKSEIVVTVLYHGQALEDLVINEIGIGRYIPTTSQTNGRWFLITRERLTETLNVSKNQGFTLESKIRIPINI